MNRQRNNNPSKLTLFFITGIILLALLGIFNFPHNNNAQPSSTSHKMGIIHIVMFEFKEEATTEQITDVCTVLLCLHFLGRLFLVYI